MYRSSPRIAIGRCFWGGASQKLWRYSGFGLHRTYWMDCWVECAFFHLHVIHFRATHLVEISRNQIWSGLVHPFSTWLAIIFYYGTKKSIWVADRRNVARMVLMVTLCSKLIMGPRNTSPPIRFCFPKNLHRIIQYFLCLNQGFIQNNTLFDPGRRPDFRDCTSLRFCTCQFFFLSSY